MIKVIEMRQAIQSVLTGLYPRVYYHKAPDNAQMPYIVFDFPNSVNFGALENYVMDIDIWDDNTDTTELETLCDSVDQIINKMTILLNDKMSISIYRENRLNIIDDDERLRRRKYIYVVKTYEKYY